MVSSVKVKVLLPLIILAASCGNSKHLGKSQAAMPGTWQRQPIIIDGDSKDWPSPYPNYDAKAKVAYATSNDRENLYITMETGDEMTQMKILKQGMTVSIDTGGHKNPEFNINYPLLNENDDIDLTQKDFGKKKSAIPGYEDKQLDKKLGKTALEANQFTVDGFSGCTGGYMVKQTTPCGISVRLSIDEYKELVWEAVIPFKTIYGKQSITAAQVGKPISVCFAVKGFKKTDSKTGAGDNNNTGMNNGMAGAGTNSSMRGGSPGGGRSKGGARSGVQENPLQHLYENTKTWKFFSLAWDQQ